MPTYEYKREDGTTFEVMQGINDDPLTTCPTTGQKVKRVISGGGGVVYKGNGFYITDYKNNGRKTAATSEPAKNETAESKPDSAKTTKSETTAAE